MENTVRVLEAHLDDEGTPVRLVLLDEDFTVLQSADIFSSLNAWDDEVEDDFFDEATKLAASEFSRKLTNSELGSNDNPADNTIMWAVEEN